MSLCRSLLVLLFRCSLFKWSNCSYFEDRTPVDFSNRYTIFKNELQRLDHSDNDHYNDCHVTSYTDRHIDVSSHQQEACLSSSLPNLGTTKTKSKLHIHCNLWRKITSYIKVSKAETVPMLWRHHVTFFQDFEVAVTDLSLTAGALGTLQKNVENLNIRDEGPARPIAQATYDTCVVSAASQRSNGCSILKHLIEPAYQLTENCIKKTIPWLI